MNLWKLTRLGREYYVEADNASHAMCLARYDYNKTRAEKVRKSAELNNVTPSHAETYGMFDIDYWTKFDYADEINIVRVADRVIRSD